MQSHLISLFNTGQMRFSKTTSCVTTSTCPFCGVEFCRTRRVKNSMFNTCTPIFSKTWTMNKYLPSWASPPRSTAVDANTWRTATPKIRRNLRHNKIFDNWIRQGRRRRAHGLTSRCQNWDSSHQRAGGVHASNASVAFAISLDHIL